MGPKPWGVPQKSLQTKAGDGEILFFACFFLRGSEKEMRFQELCIFRASNKKEALMTSSENSGGQDGPARLYALNSNPPRRLLTIAERASAHRAQVKARCARDPEFSKKYHRQRSQMTLRRYYRLKQNPDEYAIYRAKQRESRRRWFEKIKDDPEKWRRYKEIAARARDRFLANLRLIRAEHLKTNSQDQQKPSTIKEECE